jgi:hypothetical protein
MQRIQDALRMSISVWQVSIIHDTPRASVEPGVVTQEVVVN